MTINADGTTSNGSQFQRIDKDVFILDYVKYKIVDSHIEVVGCDQNEIEFALNGKVEIYSKIILDGITFNVRAIYKEAFNKCKTLESIMLPNSITTIAEYAFKECSSLKEKNYLII